MSAIKILLAAVKSSQAAMSDEAVAVAVGPALAELSGLQIFPNDLPTLRTGEFAELRMSATGGMPPYKFSISDKTMLPAGLEISEDGVISGTPRQPGGPFMVEVTDAEGGTAFVVPALSVVGPVIADPSAPITESDDQGAPIPNVSSEPNSPPANPPADLPSENQAELPPAEDLAPEPTPPTAVIEPTPAAPADPDAPVY